MGGRGTFASGNDVKLTYKTVGVIEGVKVLEGIAGKHSLPEEAKSSCAYIKLKPDGTFHEMRFYGKDKYLIAEIAYHPEPNLDKTRQNVLHIHEYKIKNDFSKKNREARLLTLNEIQKFKKYFIGVKI